MAKNLRGSWLGWGYLQTVCAAACVRYLRVLSCSIVTREEGMTEESRGALRFFALEAESPPNRNRVVVGNMAAGVRDSGLHTCCAGNCARPRTTGCSRSCCCSCCCCCCRPRCAATAVNVRGRRGICFRQLLGPPAIPWARLPQQQQHERDETNAVREGGGAPPLLPPLFGEPSIFLSLFVIAKDFSAREVEESLFFYYYL